MIEILPIKTLTDSDSTIFGSLNVALGKLSNFLQVANGVIVTPPNLKLKTTLEHFDFKTKEVFEQSLALVKKEIFSIPVPEILSKEVKGHKQFLVEGKVLNSQKELWVSLLHIWIEQVKSRLWREGFYKGITEGLEPQVVIFINKLESSGLAYFDPIQDDTVINVKVGKIHPNDLKILDERVRNANKKLFIPHEYAWIVDKGLKFIKVKQYTPPQTSEIAMVSPQSKKELAPNEVRSAVKIFFDLSTGLTIEKKVDGIFISAEKIFDLNKPRDTFEDMVFKLVESATTFPSSPILFKLADKSEGMGKVRGSLRLLHQQSLFSPMVDALNFVRHKRGYTNVHIVVPFVRGVLEFLQIKRELATAKLMRKSSLKLWLEAAVPENIVNLEDYLVAGLDGVVLNLDELIAHLNGFDSTQEDLMFYKNEVKGLLRFLEDSLKLLHKSKIPFLAYGSLSLYPQVLEFLVEKGVFGIVIERYEASSAYEHLHQAERRLILRRSS